jgi:hypothetical protein
VRERLPGEDPAAQVDAPLAGEGVRAPPAARDDPQQPGPLGLVREAAGGVPRGDAARHRALGLLARGKGTFRSLPLAGGWTKGRDLPAPEPGGTFMARYAKAKRARR